MIEQKYKIRVIGDSGVGKRSLIKASSVHYDDDFSEKCLDTIGTKVSKKVVETGNYKVTELLWDIAGKENLGLREKYYSGTKAAIIVADVTRPETIEKIDEYIEEVYKKAGKVPIAIVGNKIDKIEKKKRIGIINKFSRLAKKYDTEYFLSSADEKTNINEPFEYLAEKLAGGQASAQSSAKEVSSEEYLVIEDDCPRFITSDKEEAKVYAVDMLAMRELGYAPSCALPQKRENDGLYKKIELTKEETEAGKKRVKELYLKTLA